MPSFNHREVARQVAADLLDIEAVFLRPDEPFTWASGIRSPIYCDNRLILSHPQVRTRVERGLADLVEAAYPETEMLMGTATAGIAHAAPNTDLGHGLTARYSFSSKPNQDGYPDYYVKMSTYATILAGPAAVLEPGISARVME